MDNLSKNVCLIGILHMLGYILFSLDPLLTIIRMLNAGEEGK